MSTTEKMSLRAALNEKKLLDNKIDKLSKFNFVEVIKKSDRIVQNGGYTINDWEKASKANWQKLNDLIKRREVINLAILKANVENELEVPKFVSFDKISTKATKANTEKISYAAAIARKGYYQNVLSHILNVLTCQVSDRVKYFKNTEERIKVDIFQHIEAQFANVPNVTLKQKLDYEKELTDSMSVDLKDPANIVNNLNQYKEAVEDYLNNIDVLLGHATETTEISITY